MDVRNCPPEGMTILELKVVTFTFSDGVYMTSSGAVLVKPGFV